MTVYELENVVSEHGGFRLQIEHLRFEQGRIYALTGPNGSGKTTLLNMLAFMTVPRSGRLTFCGNAVDPPDADALLANRRRIGYLMQNPYLFNTSVRDNIRYGLDLRGMPGRAAEQRVTEVAEQLGVTHLLSTNARRLSGGETQRVAVARTLAIKPEVLLLDEPTANVDKQNIRVVEDVILSAGTSGDTSVIMSTHSSDQAYRLTHRLVSVIEGQATDTGYENVFTGTLSLSDDGSRSIRIADTVDIQPASGAEGRVTIVIDPTEIIISDSELHSSALNRLHGTIAKTEGADGSVRVFLDCGVTLCALVTSKSYADLNLNIGRQVWATFKANAVKVL